MIVDHHQRFINHPKPAPLQKAVAGEREDGGMNGKSHFAEIMAYSLDLSQLFHTTSSSPVQRKIKSSGSSTRSKVPPQGYVCRLCKVPGHWIEECMHFQHRSPALPRHCLLCDSTNHRMEKCDRYRIRHKAALNHTAKSYNGSALRGELYFYSNEEFLNF